jgi:hypothetical protein
MRRGNSNADGRGLKKRNLFGELDVFCEEFWDLALIELVKPSFFFAVKNNKLILGNTRQ